MVFYRARPHNLSSVRGFSLVELSIVVAIISVVATLGLEVAANFVNRTSNSVSRERLKVVDEATAAFFKIYGRLPCPALISLAPVPVNNYGLEDCSIAFIPGTTIGGGVVAGAVPFRTLGLPMIYSLDGFNSKFHYVVTKNLTSAGFDTTQFGNAANWGGIEIRTGVLEQPCDGSSTKCQKLANPAVATKTGAAYVIFSSGADQRGAVSPRGVTLRGCATGPGELRVDTQNCVFGNNGVRTAMSVVNIDYNVFYDNRVNAGLNRASYFDDVVAWRPRSQL